MIWLGIYGGVATVALLWLGFSIGSGVATGYWRVRVWMLRADLEVQKHLAQEANEAAAAWQLRCLEATKGGTVPTEELPPLAEPPRADDEWWKRGERPPEWRGDQ